MKIIECMAGVGLILFVTNCRGSEMTLSLEQKVLTSDLVLVGTVTHIHLGDIQKFGNDKAQDTTIVIRIDECILGKETGEISFMAHSVFFSDENGSHGASAGFSNYGIQKNKRFIAYLKKSQEGFLLSGESNQFLESIAEDSNTVRDVGQTCQMVPMALKRKQLLELAVKIEQSSTRPTKKLATRSESKFKDVDKPQPESERRTP